MKIVLIGAGGVATNLGKALVKANHNIVCVYSRTLESAKILADKLNCSYTNNLISGLPQDADLYIISIVDDYVTEVINRIKIPYNAILIHTAGSLPINILEGKTSRYGVMYPLQTFSKDKDVDIEKVSVFIEGNSEQTVCDIERLASTLTRKIYKLSSNQRKFLHLAAIFACNFCNHCYTISEKILDNVGVPFDVMLPLINETIVKVQEIGPKASQTGPAVRGDKKVVNEHLEMLGKDRNLAEIYRLMSKSIEDDKL